MFEILCFGDSNTWGYSPARPGRLPRDVRWTGVLQRELGGGFFVTEDGQSGRTTVWDDPVEGGCKNGKTYLVPCLEAHKPLDAVVLMLGTNDLKKRFSVNAFDIASSAGVLLDVISKSGAGPDGKSPRVLLIAPPPLGKLTWFAEMFEDGREKSLLLGERMAAAARDHGAEFLNAADVIRSSDLDGIHFEESEHQKLGKAVAARLRKMLG